MRGTKWIAAAVGTAGAAYAARVASTWIRYGHIPPATGGDVDELADRFMPDAEICERHRIAVAAPADVTIAAAKETDLYGSRIVRAIFRARELILRAQSDDRERPKGLLDQLRAVGWGVLAETPNELVLGAATRPWDANPVFEAIAPEQFAAYREPDRVKILVTLRADPAADGGSIFRTETRAVATCAVARRKFRRYWSLLSPGIEIIRVALLPAVRAAAERRWQIDGDDLLPDARAMLTHAITIDAPPRDVWPWLVQMGGQRAGWYSWDLLDNGGVRSADHIVPRLQHLAVGDVIPMRPSGAEGFEVVRMVPERSLVLRSPATDFDGRWAFVLEPLGADRTRLITRYRASFPDSLRMKAQLPLMAALHAFMEAKQLRTLKHHAEHLHAA